MPDEIPSLHIDNDWKKQAQEEKRKLAEQEAAKKAQSTAPAAVPAATLPSAGAASAGPVSSQRAPRGREMPAASFPTLVQSLMTQALYYLGELGAPGAEPVLNLDLAKHQIDTLHVLDEKTKGNLDATEQKMLDTALYETRMRFVSVASQMI